MENLPGNEIKNQYLPPTPSQSGYIQPDDQLPKEANLKRFLKIFGCFQEQVKIFFQKQRIGFPLLWLSLIAVLLVVTLYPAYSKKITKAPLPSPAPTSPPATAPPKASPTLKPHTPYPTSRPASGPTVAPTLPPQTTVPSPQSTSTPLPQTTPPSPEPTSTPRVPNPPVINISYPSGGQSIEMDSSQTLCIVDTPTGGDTSGVQRKHNINESGWSEYVDIFTLCFDPIEGLNRFSLQYKNQYGDESSIYTRQFNFHRT